MADEWHLLPPRLPACTPRWEREDESAALLDWAASQLGGGVHGAPLERRPWSHLWRVDGAGDTWFAKENCPLQAYEAAITPLLHELAPDLVVPVRAADPRRGRLLTRGQGRTLRDSGANDVEAWCRVLAAGAVLQRRVLPAVGRLVAAGLTPLTDLPEYAEARLDLLAALPAGEPQRLAPEDADRLRTALPDVRRWADRLAALDLPATLNHNDLHDANVFADGERVRFFDFGDALLTDPLLALTVPLSGLRDQLGAGPGDARVRRAADAALEVWSDLAPMAALRAALDPALRLGCLGRVESWLRVSASCTDAELVDLGPAAGAWLMTMLADPAL